MNVRGTCGFIGKEKTQAFEAGDKKKKEGREEGKTFRRKDRQISNTNGNQLFFLSSFLEEFISRIFYPGPVQKSLFQDSPVLL